MKQIFANAGCKAALSAKALRPWALRMLAVLVIITCASTSHTAFGGALKYIGSTPENDGSVSSFEDIILRFDLSDVISESGEGEWGVCVMGTYAAALPARQKSAQLFLGEDLTAEPLMRLASTFKPQSEQFVVGNELHLSFPGIEVIPNQVYTLKVTFDCYAGKKGETTWDTSTKFTFYDNPLILRFIGDDNGNIVLKCESSSLNESSELEYLSSIKCNFNHDIDILDNFQARILEGSEVICSAESYSVDASDSKSIVINFPENTLYKGHNYSVEIPEGCISVAGEADVLNSAISIPFKGAAYKHYGYKSILPRPGTKSLLEEVQISFDLPQGAGLVYVSDDTVYPLSIYKVNDEGEDILLQTINGIYVNDQTLKFNPTCDLEWESRYKFVMDEDVFKAYEIGAIVPKRLEEYICDRIEFVCATPDRDDIPKVTFQKMSDEELTMDHLDSSIRLPMDSYEAMEESYVVQNTGHGYFPLMVSDGITTSEIGELFIQTTSDQNGLYLWPRFFRAPNANSDVDLNLELEAGKTYTLTIPEGRYAAAQPLLKKYSGNEEFTYVFHGTTPTSHTVVINGSEGHSMETTLPRHQSMTLKFAAAENWAVEDVLHNSESKGAVEEYTIEDLTEDAVIEVKHAYQGNIAFEFTTDVDSIEVDGTNYVVSREGEMIVISGLNKTETIRVYSLGGQMLSSRVADDEVVKISLPEGVYVVTVADGAKEFAFKVML